MNPHESCTTENTEVIIPEGTETDLNLPVMDDASATAVREDTRSRANKYFFILAIILTQSYQILSRISRVVRFRTYRVRFVAEPSWPIL